MLAATLVDTAADAFVGIAFFAAIIDALPAITFVVVDAWPAAVVTADRVCRIVAARVVGGVASHATAVEALAVSITGGGGVVAGHATAVVADRRIPPAAGVVHGVARLATAFDALGSRVVAAGAVAEQSAFSVALAGAAAESALIANGGGRSAVASLPLDGIARAAIAPHAEVEAFAVLTLAIVFAAPAGEIRAIADEL